MGVCGFDAALVDIVLFNQETLPHILADLVAGAVLVGLLVVLRRRVRPVALARAAGEQD